MGVMMLQQDKFTLKDVNLAIQECIASKYPEFSMENNAVTSFSAMGLSSLDQVSMSADLEDRFGTTLDETIAYDYPTVQALANRILEIANNKE